jgi:hypothetical protein
MVRRLVALLLALGAATAAALSTAAPSGALTTEVSSELQIWGGGSSAPAHACDIDLYALCSSGTFDGAEVTTTIVHDDGEFLESSCVLYLVHETVTRTDGSGSVVLFHEATLCAPTVNWWRNHESLRAFGNPFSVTSTWDVVAGSGTGVYAGATGSGTWTARFAGESGHAEHAGTITVP